MIDRAEFYARELINASWNPESATRCPECWLAGDKHDATCSQREAADA